MVDAEGPAGLVARDSCALTTWENATLTKTWLQTNHPGAPVLLITDPWQLPRAAHAFAHQGFACCPWRCLRA
ncbi:MULTISPECIES: YdcF family protein [unclassified Synechococcus]|uniref:YdcF family protein n=1 Tax=unclassified Synechococcus TaxID=2626047 RepID=UPI0039B0B5B3